MFTNVNLIVCFLLGIATAILVLFFERANATVLGLVVGYLIGNLFFYNFLIKLFQSNPMTVYWSTIVICIVSMSIAGALIKDHMIKIATSLVGAYGIARVL